jgi:hypothetical protein
MQNEIESEVSQNQFFNPFKVESELERLNEIEDEEFRQFDTRMFIASLSPQNIALSL